MGDQLTLCQRANRGQDAAQVETQSLASRADPGRKQFRQVERQPAIEGGRHAADYSNQRQKQRSVFVNCPKQQPAKNQRQQAETKISRPTPALAAEPGSDKAANDCTDS